MAGTVGTPAVAVLRELARTFVSADQFLLHRLLTALMMEESLGFVQPRGFSLVQGGEPEPKDSEYAGKTWLALRIRTVTLAIPNPRFARHVALARGVSCDTDGGARVGVPTALGVVSVPAEVEMGRRRRVA